MRYHATVPPGASVPARLPVLKGDARHDRWSGHRAEVRATLVEATIAAIDMFGPDLSIDDVVKTAGVPRPKIYRFFADKETLFIAASERIQAMVLEQIEPHFDLSGTVYDLVCSALSGYVDMADERSNLFRFLANALFSDPITRKALLKEGRQLSAVIGGVAETILESLGARSDHIEYFIDGVLGAASLASLRWIDTRAITKEAFLAELIPFVWGAILESVQARGGMLDRDTRLS